jgi:hypothetical protein
MESKAWSFHDWFGLDESTQLLQWRVKLSSRFGAEYSTF